MPLPDINEDTFVAFTDISGFKMLLSDRLKAEKVLGTFYNEGYKILDKCHRVKGLFVSDCGILIAHGEENNDLNRLKDLLRVLNSLNSKMLEAEIMLTTSIAYGHFVYEQRKELLNMEKNMLYGLGYLAAFLDNENGKPKIEPGQCRIVLDNLRQPIKGNLIDIAMRRKNIDNFNADDQVLSLLKDRTGDQDHLYYYWNVEYRGQIEQFEKQYTDAYQLKYKGFLSALKRK